MKRCLSLHSCWFPRSVLFPRCLLRSSFSTTPMPNNTPTHRSASRFSVKIARFLFSTSLLKQSAPLSTHTHYAKAESSTDIQEIARNFIHSLEPEHRQILANELSEIEKLSKATTTAMPILYSQLAVGKKKLFVYFHRASLVFIETGLPYIGFGFVDNFVMLVAGETIETFFGVAFCLSTMAAAGLGNAVSDVMGIGLADRIERTCGRFLGLFGISSPKLAAEQWRQRSVQTTQLLSKAICIFVGCLLGMCPLLFRDTSVKKTKSNDED
ncbi:unnamed protein product [Rotaria magnacalcarata]|uniref:Transmembrane protein 65 n=5 Tax=Rotaria magnacalcarata TaxID=392030 RepID=A0A819UH02_9BILA|nr:unnamed protein product [Rotaria magnacalcarata]